MIWLLALAFTLAWAGPADAAPLGAALTTIIGGGLAQTLAAGGIQAFLLRTAASMALSALGNYLSARSQPSIPTEFTTTGDTSPQSFIMGRYATAGHHIAPPYRDGKWLWYIIDLSNLPITGVVRMAVNGEWITLESGSSSRGLDLVCTAPEKYAGNIEARFYDGTQTTADSRLIHYFGDHETRPWLSDMVGTGNAYAVIAFQQTRRRLFPSPNVDVRFEVDGIKLYDPREDTTVGGDGSQRFATPTTWAFTRNPAVMAYNIRRGVTLGDDRTWGFSYPASGLPLAAWFAAMNECDVAIDLEAGGTEPQYQAGIEVKAGPQAFSGDSGIDVEAVLLRACTGEVADTGAGVTIRVGPPSLPVLFITDDDIVITRDGEFDPFPGLESTHNGVAATHPRPDLVYEVKETPPLYDDDLEAEDGDRRLAVSVQLPAVTSDTQAQRIIRALRDDNRRFRRHVEVLPPRAAILDPLDTLEWSSTRHGYEDKLFEVRAVGHEARTLLQGVTMRERDPSDYDWSTDFEVPSPTPTPGRPVLDTSLLSGWTVTATVISDADDNARRPALLLGWSIGDQSDAAGIEWQVQVSATETLVAQGTTTDTAAGSLVVSEGILPATAYRARGRLVADRPTDWTDWAAATTGAVYLTNDDFEDTVRGLLDELGLSTPEIVTSLPTTGNFEGRIVYLSTDGKLYRYHDGAWTAAVPAPDLTGLINVAEQIGDGSVIGAKLADNAVTLAKMQEGLQPIEIVDVLPETGNFKGRTVLLTTDDKLYRHTGSPTGSSGFTASVPTTDLTGQVTNAQIADMAAAKLTGQITGPQINDGAITDAKIAGIAAGKITGSLQNDQIAAVDAAKLTGQISETQVADNAISTPKLAAGAVETAKLAAGAVVADKIGANAVTAVKINAGAVETAKLAVGAVEAEKIAAGAVVADKIGANAVTAVKIQAGAVETEKLAAGSVVTAKLAAASVIASKLAIGDFTNLVLNPKLTTVDGWTIDNAAYTELATAPSGMTEAGAFWFKPGLTSSNLWARYSLINVTSGKTYRFSAEFVNSGASPNSNPRIAANWYAKNDIFIGSDISPSGSSITGTSITNVSGVWVAPAGAVRVQFLVGRTYFGSSAGDLYCGSPIVRLMGDGELIVDGSITADKVASNAITTDKLEAGSITTAKIGAGQITTPLLAVGSGKNILYNSTFSAGLSGFQVGGFGGAFSQTSMSLRVPPTSWSGPNYPTLMLYQNGTSTDGYFEVRLRRPGADGVDFAQFPVSSGQRLEASAYISTHRCSGTIYVFYYDASNVYIGAGIIASITDNVQSSSNNPELWPRYGGFLTAPANTASAVLAIRKNATSGGSNSFLFIHKPMLAVAPANATELSDWSSDGVTMITGDEIVTGAIKAGKLAANSVVAGNVAAGAVTAGTIASRSITADRIATGALTANEIATGTLTAALINTSSFASSGLAIFGGSVQSSDYASGSQGWKWFQNGNAELWNLIVRGSLVVGAVSDIEQSYLSSSYNWANTGEIGRTNIQTGVTTPTDLWIVHMAWEYRPVGDATGDIINVRLKLRRRVKVGGVWSAYEYVSENTAPGGGGSSWFSRVYTEFFTGEYEDIQYQVTNQVNILGSGSSLDNYRKVNLTARKIER
jgi:hypothetical protein